MQLTHLALTLLLSTVTARELNKDDIPPKCQNEWSCENVVNAASNCPTKHKGNSFGDGRWEKCVCKTDYIKEDIEICIDCVREYKTHGDLYKIRDVCGVSDDDDDDDNW